MPWYIRKSLSRGPVRLNLSKRGLGLSLGVKGLRIGTGPKGPYVAGGRGGLYYRQYLGSKQRAKVRASALSPGTMFWLAIIIIVISRLFSVPLVAAAIGTIGVLGGLYVCALLVDAQRRRTKAHARAAASAGLPITAKPATSLEVKPTLHDRRVSGVRKYLEGRSLNLANLRDHDNYIAMQLEAYGSAFLLDEDVEAMAHVCECPIEKDGNLQIDVYNRAGECIQMIRR